MEILLLFCRFTPLPLSPLSEQELAGGWEVPEMAHTKDSSTRNCKRKIAPENFLDPERNLRTLPAPQLPGCNLLKSTVQQDG